MREPGVVNGKHAVYHRDALLDLLLGGLGPDPHPVENHARLAVVIGDARRHLEVPELLGPVADPLGLGSLERAVAQRLQLAALELLDPPAVVHDVAMCVVDLAIHVEAPEPRNTRIARPPLADER